MNKKLDNKKSINYLHKEQNPLLMQYQKKNQKFQFQIK